MVGGQMAGRTQGDLEVEMQSARFLRSPALLGLLGLAVLIAVAIFRAPYAEAATPSFGTATVTDNLFLTDEKNDLLRHNIPNLLVFADGQSRSADFKNHFENTGAIERWGLPISEVFEEESGALTQYYQRGAVDFHKRADLGGIWVIERRLTWDYMGGGAGGSVDMGVEQQITNPNDGDPVGPWGHKVSNLDVQGETTGFRDFFDRLGGVESFGFPKTDARADTGASGTLLAPGSTVGIVRQYFQAAVFEFFPENPDLFKVQLTLLGDFLRNRTYTENRWASLTPFLAAAELRDGGLMTLVAVDRAPPTPAATPTPMGPAPTPTATPLPEFNPNNELIVVGTRTRGIAIYDGVVWRTIDVENSALGSNRINALFVDSQRRIWAGTDSGVFRLNTDLSVGPAFREDNSGIGSNDISAISGDSSATIWIGLASRGASSYTAADLENPWRWFRTDSSSIPSNSVRGLFMQDIGQNRVWIATAAGAARYDGTTNAWTVLKVADGLASNDVNSVAIGADGTLWFGTNGFGLSSTPSVVPGPWTTYTTGDGLGNNEVRNVLVSSGGTIWAATAGGVIRVVDQLEIVLVHNDTRALAEDSQGNLWIATGSGVNRYNPGTKQWTAFRTEQGLSENDTLAIAVVPRS